MMLSAVRLASAGLLLMAAAMPAGGQTPVAAREVRGDWTRGTTVSLAVGGATSSSDPGPMVGGALGWEVMPRLTLEGSGAWLDRGGGADAYNAALKLRAWVRHQGTSPFVEGGFGLYRMTMKGSGEMPEFYRRRMVTNSAGITSQAFTDPVFHLGAGINIFASRHFALQPAMEALIVTRGSRVHTLAAFYLRVAYHFEDRPVTPARR